MCVCVCVHRCTGGHVWDDGSQQDDTKQLQAIWSALCNGQPAPLLPHKHSRGSHAGGAEEEDSKLLAVLETARVEKHVKSRLAVAADHFNRDYKKGFQFLQVSNPFFSASLFLGASVFGSAGLVSCLVVQIWLSVPINS